MINIAIVIELFIMIIKKPCNYSHTYTNTQWNAIQAFIMQSLKFFFFFFASNWLGSCLFPVLESTASGKETFTS